MFDDKESIVELTVFRHKVSIVDELVVTVKHTKKCKMPCNKTEQIVQYLDDEMFLAEGFKIEEE